MRAEGQPPRYAFRLEDLRQWHIIEAVCWQCNRTAVIRHDVLKRGRPLHARVVDLEAKLRCKECDRRGGHSLSIRSMPRD